MPKTRKPSSSPSLPLSVGPTDFPFRVAAPSWVWPGTVGENCRRLGEIFDEIGILLFESKACLEYGEEDLPRTLAELSLNYHLHLPLDLPWKDGILAVSHVITSLLDKTAFLDPWGFVVHAPPHAKQLDELAFCFIHKGIKPDRVLLENTKEFNPLEFWCDIRYLGLNLCLDLGHLMLYGQERLLELPRLWPRVKLVHLCAPAPDGRHLPLTELDAEGRALVRIILSRMSPDTVVMPEVFDPEGLAASMAVLHEVLSGGG
ncbi:hypothetical protein dsx2_2152 [Desulfovibrio sp. X2]|uniref:cobamide remodeling phosphodiesterase CbiR n=1 Tax=Desulfovibrio sp. X2 TaxID=941449 RepID=UPI000358BDCA|nr:cobamide remodeling phosphodiesterase CbiR [Desulfovibrio sp. X2]EPR43725.1 hypothetical protein dsx2_2152 [Desulfovibrio sp. X2]